MKKSLLLLLPCFLFAASQKLLPNTKILYLDQPKSATTLDEFFANSKVYLRLRSHYIAWNWDKENAKRKDNWGYGIGGSLTFKSAWVHHFGITTALYTSQDPWHMRRSDVGFVKTGKDFFSRYEVAKGKGFGVTVLGQSYLEYKDDAWDLKAGRQIFTSMLAQPNDSKMIPNTFEGVSLQGKKGSVEYKLAYFTKQKLRYKEHFHDVVTYGKDLDGDGRITGYEKWANNDDSAVNHALSYVHLQRAGKSVHNRLLITQLRAGYKSLKTTLNASVVPGLFGLFAIEPRYEIDLKSGRIIPQMRYIRQLDLGAKDIGRLGIPIANLKGDAAGYRNPYTLYGWLYAVRVDWRPKASFWWARVGYSQVGDHADIVDPWRGAPTGGYTRAMSVYNWYADTKSWMGRIVLDLDKAKLVRGLQASLRYIIEDYDDRKPGVQADAHCIDLDLFEKVPHIDGLYVKLRWGLTRGTSATQDMYGRTKADPSFQEFRFEINYLL